MSQAFVRESDDQWLHEVAPTLQALIMYLSKENNGIRVYEIKTSTDKKYESEIHHMSNGLNYIKNKDMQWEVCG